MKKLSFLLIAFLSFAVLHAQQDKKAKQLLNEVSQKVQSYDNMLIEFSYILENPTENIKQETRGDVTLQDEKYRLNLMGTTRLFDGEKLYSIIPEDEEVNISDYDAKENNDITPSKMLTFYNEGYNYKWGKVNDVNGRKIQYIQLTPIDSDADIKEILLGIDKQTKHIYDLIQKQDNGTQVTIRVNSFKTNQPLSSKMFTFDEDKYQGYYINRLD
ncbi:LolA family protein [Haloflavibacter putidus]|uniref:Outer membrane lipoprotein carrier protein LolA n=1 Tax=Haloflavibacter putidus TaxID=2576776 RepID=A0A507ZPH9_9FLAO|nr:outer membrane lipoprotein carrier protein LolA [Haloflavibacter putidus]TQD38917.1 outer membrane lipoprotein carrier protein LolA [Haloflavibacter putidus]